MEILIIDCSCAQELNRLLTEQGHNVTCVSRLTVARGILEKIPYDLMIFEFKKKNFIEMSRFLLQLRILGELRADPEMFLIGICAEADDSEDVRRASEIPNNFLFVSSPREAAPEVVAAVKKAAENIGKKKN